VWSRDAAPATLAVHDPPYNFIAFNRRRIEAFTEWCRQVVGHTAEFLAADASLYLWIGADQDNGFRPASGGDDMMRETRLPLAQPHHHA
jgi:site-specific DNA-methyltransferase (adenine-specific)